MKLPFRGRSAALPLLLLASFSAPIALLAQENGIIPNGKILYISREYTKPGKDGGPHEKTESAFVAALTAAKWPDHYLAMTSMSGRPRPSFTLSTMACTVALR